MILQAVVCPGAPLLIPDLAPRLAAEVPELIDACHRAMDFLRTADRVLLLSCGPRLLDGDLRGRQFSVVHPPGTVVSSAVITGSSGPVHFSGRLPGAPAGTGAGRPPPGVGTVVGAALLDRAGIDVAVTAIELADRTAEVDALLTDARTSADRVGLLVLADGSGNRGSGSQGGDATYAGRLDTALAAALADGHPGDVHRVAVVARAAAQRALFGSGPALLALAELTANRPPQQAALLLHQETLGVGYLVATWSWAPMSRP